MALIDNVILNNEDVLVIGGPSSVTLSLDFGKQGNRGTKIFADDSTPTSYFTEEVNQSLDIQLYDMFLNTATNDLYQYVNTEPYSWTLIGNLEGTGEKGDPGPTGPAGQGLTTGGTAGQILVKLSGTNYDTAWIDNYATSTKHLVKNSTGATLSKGSVVYISGATGTNMLVSLADADTEMTSSKTVGFLETNLDQGDTGYVITSGLLAGLNTNGAAAAGQSIWLSSTAGQFVYGSPPAEPAHSVYLGVVTRKQSVNGEIFIHVSNGWELDELHGVSVPSPVANDLLYYDATGLWKNSSITDLGIVKTGSTTNKVANNMLDNSKVVIGSTHVNLGDTITTLPGITSVQGTAGNVTVGNTTGTSTILGAPININSTGSGTVTVSGGTGNTAIGNTTGTTDLVGAAVSINTTAGAVTIGNASSSVNVPILRVTSTVDATSATTTHGFQVGPQAGVRLVIDTDEIHAYNGATPSNLKLNEDGGTVTIASANAASTTTINGPLVTATGTSAIAPLRIPSGTNLNTATGGVVEYDGKTFYATPNTSSGRAYIPQTHYFALTTARTQATPVSGTAYDLFGQKFTVAANTAYEFEMQLTVSNPGTVANTLNLLFALADGASLTSIGYSAVTTNGTSLSTPNATSASWATAATAFTVCASVAAATARTVIVKGTIRTSAAGSIRPQYSHTGAPGNTTTIGVNSYIKLTPLGSDTVTSVGTWSA